VVTYQIARCLTSFLRAIPAYIDQAIDEFQFSVA
jgi:hypothetical protein